MRTRNLMRARKQVNAPRMRRRPGLAQRLASAATTVRKRGRLPSLRAWLGCVPRSDRAAHPRYWVRRLVVSMVVSLGLVGALISQANGPLGASAADVLRAVLGPQVTAQFEAWYLGIQDAGQRAQYQFTDQPVSAPWAANLSGSGAQRLRVPSMPLPAMAPLVQPPLADEGVWSAAGSSPPSPGIPPLVAKAFLRPDPTRPYAVVTLLQFDLRFDIVHLVAGKQQPGGPLGHAGPGAIPANMTQGNALLAAFNGGFKYADGRYGMMAQGIVYAPPQPGAATIAITRDGHLLLGAWGLAPGLQETNANLVAWRQNGALLIDNGMLNPLTNDGAAWGGTVLNRASTWRSGIGITAHHTLIYAAGNALTAATLGLALRRAGAVYAMQMDINPLWVRAFLYQRAASGAWVISKLHPGMQGTGTEYFTGSARDFFYITH